MEKGNNVVLDIKNDELVETNKVSTERASQEIKISENRCFNCQALVKDGQIFCPECGNKLIEICNRCGFQLMDDQCFCPNCGQKRLNSLSQIEIEKYNLDISKKTNKKNKLFPILFVITFVVLIITAVCGVYKITELNNDIQRKQKEISSLESENSSLKSKVSLLNNELTPLRNLSDFIDMHVSFIEDDGTYYYHKYTCDRFKGKSFWVYNTEAVKNRYIYTKCPYCH